MNDKYTIAEATILALQGKLDESKELKTEGNLQTVSGNFYIGDPCYVLDDDIYYKVWGDKYNFRDGQVDAEGKGSFIVSGTKYGDGCYLDNDGYEYGVDSGTIALIPEELIAKKDGISDGRIVPGNKGTLLQCNDDGIIHVIIDNKDIFIDTDPESSDDSDLYESKKKLVKTESKQRLPAKYKFMVKDLYQGGDGFWVADFNEGYTDGCGNTYLHEKSLKAILQTLETLYKKNKKQESKEVDQLNFTEAQYKKFCKYWVCVNVTGDALVPPDDVESDVAIIYYADENDEDGVEFASFKEMFDAYDIGEGILNDYEDESPELKEYGITEKEIRELDRAYKYGLFESTNKSEENPQEFTYKMLSRLKSDCDYYLGNGNRNAEHALWAKNEEGQIAEMRKLYNQLKEKPEWLTWEDIDEYAKAMGVEELPSTTDGTAEKEIQDMLDRSKKRFKEESINDDVLDDYKEFCLDNDCDIADADSITAFCQEVAYHKDKDAADKARLHITEYVNKLEEAKKLKTEDHALLSRLYAVYPDITDEDEDYLNSLSHDELVSEIENRGWGDILEEAKKTLDDVYADESLEAIWDTKFNELVPKQGKASTALGEIMRCFAATSHALLQNGEIIANMQRYYLEQVWQLEDALKELGDTKLIQLLDKMYNTRSESAYDHYMAEFYEYFVNTYLKDSKEVKEENATEDYWGGTEIARDGFMSLMKFNFGTDSKGNNYIITVDANDVKRFRANSDEEAIKVYEAFKEDWNNSDHADLTTDVKNIAPRNESKKTESEDIKPRLDGDELYVARNSSGYKSIGLIVNNKTKQFQIINGQVMTTDSNTKKISKKQIRDKAQELYNNGYEEYKGYGSIAQGVIKKTEAEDMTQVKSEIEKAKAEDEDATKQELEQIKGSLNVLKTDEEEAISGYKVFIQNAKEIVDDKLANALDNQMEEIVQDEEDHIEKLDTIKTALDESKDTSYKSDIMKNLNIEVGSDEEAELDSILDTDYDLVWDELDDEEQAKYLEVAKSIRRPGPEEAFIDIQPELNDKAKSNGLEKDILMYAYLERDNKEVGENKNMNCERILNKPKNESKKLQEHNDSWLVVTPADNHRVKPFVDLFKKTYPDKQIDKLWLEGIEGGWEPCVAYIESNGTVYRVFVGELNDGMYMSNQDSVKIASSDFKSQYDYVDESKKLKTEDVEEFSGVEFEKSVPHVMRWKEWDIVNDNDLYWITQQFFKEDDVKQFAEAFKTTPFDKAYVTVRDLSTYSFEADTAHNVLVVINKDGSYDMSDYLATCKKYNYDESLYESKPVEESLEQNEEDGWGEDVEDILSPCFEKSEQLAYEVRNCVRGSYAGFGDTVNELIEEVQEIARMYEEAADELESQSQMLQEAKKETECNNVKNPYSEALQNRNTKK